MSDEEPKKLTEQLWAKVLMVVIPALATSAASYWKSSGESEDRTAASYTALTRAVQELQDQAETNAKEIARIQGRIEGREDRLGAGWKVADPLEAPRPANQLKPIEQRLRRLPSLKQAMESYQEKK